MLQFWNLLNARAFATGKWAFNNMEDSKVFWAVATIILVGQIVIVQLLPTVFNCAPLGFWTWLTIIVGTSPVFLLGHFMARVKNNQGRVR
jgi:Ca2+-transporting ATPase